MVNKIVIILVWIAVGIAVIWGVGAVITKNKIKNEANLSVLDNFAKCLTDKGVRMYGADWCPHCQNQKKLFGASFHFINYTECAVPGNPRQQAKACSDADVTGYPTWIFANGERIEGETTFGELAKKSECEYK